MHLIMKCFVLLITTFIWRFVLVTGHPVNLRKSQIYPINSKIPLAYPSTYVNGEEVNPFLPLYASFWTVTKKKPEYATKGKSNDEEEKSTSQVQKRETNKLELIESGNKNLDMAVDNRNMMIINDIITHREKRHTLKDTTKGENANKNNEKVHESLFYKIILNMLLLL